MQLAEDRRTIIPDNRCFYDLCADPFEERNLAGSASELERELAQRLSAWNAQTPWLEQAG